MTDHNTLVIGGTSGLGSELGKRMQAEGSCVTVTGRHDPGVNFAAFAELDLTAPSFGQRISALLAELPPIDTLIYAAGFYQEGHITDLEDGEVEAMLAVGSLGPIMCAKRILEQQARLPEALFIGSTSQEVPRELEPIYCHTKAGTLHLAHSLSKAPRVDRTLVAATSGMRTPFWDGVNRDTSTMMDPAAVATQIMRLRDEDYSFQRAKILGNPGDGSIREVETTLWRYPETDT